MNELIIDIKALQEQTLNNLRNSKANNTIRAYKSDFKDFSTFCARNGFKSLPTESKIVSLYITYLSSKNAKISTLRRRLVSIGVIHRLKGHYLDTKHPIIIENLMGIKRKKGSFQQGKKPILILFNIHIPLMSLSILLSLVLIFIEIIKELSATLILRPFNFNTLAIQVYEYASEGKIIESSIPSLIIVVLCVIGIIFMSIISNQLFKSGKT